MKRNNWLAIALIVGWYLMTPPTIPGRWDIGDLDAPIRRWAQRDSYDSASACRDDRQKYVNSYLEETNNKDNHFNANQKAYGNLMAWLYANGLCIEADDPRLK